MHIKEGDGILSRWDENLSPYNRDAGSVLELVLVGPVC